MNFNISRQKNFNFEVKAQKNEGHSREIPQHPEARTFILESSNDRLKVWSEDPGAPGNMVWRFQYVPTHPEDVNVTIGEN